MQRAEGGRSMRGGAVLLATLALVLAGCAGPTEQEAGSIDPGPETFLLTVDVVSATGTPVALAGASVSAGRAEGNRTSGATDGAGSFVLELRAPQIIAVEVTADGYAGVGTVPLRIGNSTAQDAASQIGAAFVCAFSFGLACPIDATTTLTGSQARILLRMVPSSIERVVDVRMGAAASNPATGQTGMFVPVPLAGNADLDALYAAQLARAEGKLAWTNAPGAQGDLEFAMYCGEFFDAGAVTESGSPATLAAMGPRELALTFNTPQPCAPLFAGAWVDSATTDLVAQATLQLRFGPGIQRPG